MSEKQEVIVVTVDRYDQRSFTVGVCTSHAETTKVLAAYVRDSADSFLEEKKVTEEQLKDDDFIVDLWFNSSMCDENYSVKTFLVDDCSRYL